MALHMRRLSDDSVSWQLPSRTACLGLHLATRAPLPAPAETPLLVFRDVARVVEALARGSLVARDVIVVRGVAGLSAAHGLDITVGRLLVAMCVPPAFRSAFTNAPCTRALLATTLADVMLDEHVEIAARGADALEVLGVYFVQRSGLSLTARDFAAPSARDEHIAHATRDVLEVNAAYAREEITDGERYNRIVDTWAGVTERVVYAARADAGSDDVLEAFAAADESDMPPERTRAMLGLQAKASGEIFEHPVVHSLGEGLAPHEFMMTCRAARARELTRAQRVAVANAMYPDLRDALGGVRIAGFDCGTTRGVNVGRDCEDGAASLRVRVVGRVLTDDVIARTGKILAHAGDLVTRALARRIDDAQVAVVRVRDPLACVAEDGVCAKCFGLDPEDATWLATGDDVGERAARAIAEGARAFSNATFHVC